MKQTRKLLAILLALVLAMSAICVTAFAAHKKQYQSYVFFGDSVTTGFGIQSYTDVADEGGTAEGKRVPGAYPDLVAKGVGIDENNENYYNEAHSGWRTSELRETLDPTYNNEDGAVAKALSEGMANGKTLCDPQDPALQARIREAIAKSDLVTIDLGSNDIQLPIIMALYAAIYPQYASYFGQPEYKDWVVEDLLKKYGSENDMILKMTETLAKIHGIEYALEVVSKAALGGLYKFNTNYPAIINLIHEINPNADIYVIGLYNPMSEATLTDDIPIKVGKALDPVIMSLNLYLAQLSPAKRYYTYVDAFNTSVIGTISLASFVGSDMNLAGMGEYTINIHPNDAGHAYIAKQVLNAIPDVEDPAPAEEPAQDDPAQPAQDDGRCTRTAKSIRLTPVLPRTSTAGGASRTAMSTSTRRASIRTNTAGGSAPTVRSRSKSRRSTRTSTAGGSAPIVRSRSRRPASSRTSTASGTAKTARSTSTRTVKSNTTARPTP